jgi:Ca2+/Na+ antiporter
MNNNKSKVNFTKGNAQVGGGKIRSNVRSFKKPINVKDLPQANDVQEPKPEEPILLINVNDVASKEVQVLTSPEELNFKIVNVFLILFRCVRKFLFFLSNAELYVMLAASTYLIVSSHMPIIISVVLTALGIMLYLILYYYKSESVALSEEQEVTMLCDCGEVCKKFHFTYPAQQTVNTFWGPHTTFIPGESYVPQHVATALLTKIPLVKTLSSFNTFWNKAMNTPNVANWYSSTKDGSTVKKQKRLKRFFWFDHKNVHKERKILSAFSEQLQAQEETKSWWSGSRKFEEVIGSSMFSDFSASVKKHFWTQVLPSSVYFQLYLFFSVPIAYMIVFHVSMLYVRDNFLRKVPQLTLFSIFPNWSVKFEEYFREFPGFTNLQSWVESYLNKCPKSAMDMFFNRLKTIDTYEDRVQFHNLLNRMMLDDFTVDPLLQVDNEYARSLIKKVETGILDELEDGYDCAPKTIPPIRLGWTTKDTKCVTMHNQDGRIDFFDYQGIYPFCFPVSHMVKPAPTLENMQLAMEQRITNHPEPEIGESVVRYWQDFLDDHFSLWAFRDEKHKLKYWTKVEKRLLPKQRNRIQQDLQMFEGTAPFDIKMGMKSDELLYSKEKAVPRVLFDCSGYWTYKFGAAVEYIGKQMKKCFDGKTPISAHKKTFYPFYASGATSSQISSIYTQATRDTDSVFIMAMGDDSAQYQKECDFSAFDRTQNRVLFICFADHLEKFGYFEEAEDFRFQYSLQPVMKHKKTDTKVPYKAKNGKYTGEQWTSILNSLLNIASTMYTYKIAPEQTPESISKAYARWGFVAKYQTHKYVTFLRGVFLPDIHGEQTWVRLPSFLGKFGKTMTDWRIKGETDQVASARMLYSMWLGYGNMRNNWFFIAIGKEIKRITLMYLKELPGKSDHLQSWQIFDDTGESNQYIDNPIVSDEVFDEFIAERYGECVDLHAIVDIFKKIEHLPCLWFSKDLMAILDRDY